MGVELAKFFELFSVTTLFWIWVSFAIAGVINYSKFKKKQYTEDANDWWFSQLYPFLFLAAFSALIAFSLKLQDLIGYNILFFWI